MLQKPAHVKTSSWQNPPTGASNAAVWRSPHNQKIEVAVLTTPAAPTPGELISAWSARQKNSSVGLLVVWESAQDRFGACFGRASTSTTAKPAVAQPINAAQAKALVELALSEDSNHEQAASDVLDAISELNSQVPGLSNGGLLAIRHLNADVRNRPDWAAAANKSASLRTKRGTDLLRGLGFTLTKAIDRDVSLLNAPDGSKRATAVLIDVSAKQSTWLDKAYQAAQANSVEWIIAVDRHQMRLYPAKAGVGVAGRGPLETYVEVNLALLSQTDISYLWLLFSHEALALGGTLEKILAESTRFAVALGERLRERIYNRTVRHLVDAIVDARKSVKRPVSPQDATPVYHQALTYLFRLLFLAYAEDRDLLPATANQTYRNASLTDIAGRLHKGEAVSDLDARLNSLFNAVDTGNLEWDVPAYNGGLFATAGHRNPIGAELASLTLPDEHLRLALAALLLDTDPKSNETGPVDFRSLRVREFGTIYEGLLESELSFAATNLTIGKEGDPTETLKGKSPDIKKDSLYLHNKSGARKAAGAYFTPAFAVDHLLDQSLEPSLARHCSTIETLVAEGKSAEAGQKFFDFRVADLAMGSGHFLVAAADRVAAGLAALHAKLQLKEVSDQLEELRKASKQAVVNNRDVPDITLMRRIAARRCVYGMDINPMSTELTRLSLWIHTFIPGLPMSYMGHTLRAGNSLTGIGTMDELVRLLNNPPTVGRRKKTQNTGPTLFGGGIQSILATVQTQLGAAIAATDATAADVHAIEQQVSQLETQTAQAKSLCDILVMLRAGAATAPVDWTQTIAQVVGAHGPASAEFAEQAGATHYPIIWPEVFASSAPGFDVCTGNPPWEKLKVESHAFWARYQPGLRSLDKKERDQAIADLAKARPDLVKLLTAEKASAAAARAVIATGPFDMGSGDPDLYQAFCWRNWYSVKSDGAVGMVLPRGALAGSGAVPWRKEIYDNGEFTDVVVLGNDRKWVFQIDSRFTVALVSIRKGASGDVRLRGPFKSLAEFLAGVTTPASPVPSSEFREFASGGAFPQLPSTDATDVYRQMRLSPRFDDSTHPWEARPTTELHSSQNANMMCSQTASSLPIWSGRNFNRWLPDAGKDPYSWAEPAIAGKFIHERIARRKEAKDKKRTKEVEDGPTLFSVESTSSSVPAPVVAATPDLRLAFRGVARATDSRTVIAAMIPAGRYLVEMAPYLRFERGGRLEEAALLGALCSTPLDWFARRLIETKVNFELLNGFPVPHLGDHIRRIAQIAGLRTARADKRLENWAVAAGADLTETTLNENLDAELDARIACAYGLTQDHVKTIWATYGPGAAGLPDLNKVLALMTQFCPGGTTS